MMSWAELAAHLCEKHRKLWVIEDKIQAMQVAYVTCLRAGNGRMAGIAHNIIWELEAARDVLKAS